VRVFCLGQEIGCEHRLNL